MKFLILAAVSLSFLGQSYAQRRPPGGGGGGEQRPPQQSDNKCTIAAEEVVLSGSGETVDSMEKCAQLAFESADRYCNYARENASENPFNPINTSWTWNGQKGTHPNFECANVAINRKGPSGGQGGGQNGGGGQGGGRPGNGGGNGGGRPEIRTETYEYTEARVREWLPHDVCLLDHPRWGRDFRRDRNRFTIDREDAFCDWDEKRVLRERCENPQQPFPSILPGTARWYGASSSLTLGNQGQPVSVTLTSTESEDEQFFVDESREYNCSERAGDFRVEYVTYRITRNADTRREIERDVIRRDRDLVPGIHLKRDPIWRAHTRSVPTGRTKPNTFTIEPAAFETQLNYSFGAVINHTEGQDPTFQFSDEFFSHTPNFGNVSSGGTVSVQSHVRPITPPSVEISSQDSKKRDPVFPLMISDRRLDQLRSLEKGTETTYTVYGRLIHTKAFGDEDWGTFTVVVPNETNNPNYSINLETLLNTAAQQTGNSRLVLDRSKNSYDIKLTVSATRRNTKFVSEGESVRTRELKIHLDKSK